MCVMSTRRSPSWPAYWRRSAPDIDENSSFSIIYIFRLLMSVMSIEHTPEGVLSWPVYWRRSAPDI